MIELIEPYICETECKHEDCPKLKDFVNNAKCRICKKQIKSGQAYYGVEDDELKHLGCVEK